jgi:hypothetical protein
VKTDIQIRSCISRPVLLTTKNVSDKSCVKTRITHFMFNGVFFENRAVYEVMWKSFVERGRPQTAIWRMHIACWISKATNTYTGYVTIISFPL